MVERFFSVPQSHFHRTHSHPSILLLSGPPSSGKTSLLFQFAFNSALESDSIKGNVVFICNRRRLESKPPFLPQDIDPSNDIFERVHMKYVDNDEGIKKYFAAFHLHDNFPCTVVIDNFGDLFDESEKGPCNLLLSDTHHGDSPRLLFIYKRWISSVYTIKDAVPVFFLLGIFRQRKPVIAIIYGDGSGSFLLKNNISSRSSLSERTRTAKYSIALQYLVLEVITEDGES
ncbi:hypothetical protein RHMOL_Rhmol12G0104900 [Rhododendron molle]|uniref:Uncharacterized protein n=1 Tax=Rhododendron molle TaxID=49168 RepID=A0ACC0LGV1_RHOML|nr:hypothetical protein RHMOL_Rhmol12G0104900 [Rhododendron molle]